MPIPTRDFLGTGLRFPLQVTAGGRLAVASDEQRVEESVYLILNTAAGERVMLPGFGCGIHDLVFAPNDPGTRGAIVQEVRRALVANEQRIDVLAVDAQAALEEPNLLLVRIDYRIRANNALGNLVFPFYLDEGA
jgi:uncharacterized protein